MLSVTHGPNVPGGIFDEVAEAAGHDVDRWTVPLGGSPQPAESYGAIMVFGGSMHPDQDAEHGWLEREEVFLRSALAQDVPMIGVCLGAQMLARAAGAWVGPARKPEIGWYEVDLTAAGRDDPVLGVLPARLEAFEWHHYTFGIPEGGEELARSASCTQAFRVGERAWGLQFHAEVTVPMVRSWVTDGSDELPVPAEAFLDEAEPRMAAWNGHGRHLCQAFLDVAGTRARARPATARGTRAGRR
jgi:GMP synthase (glutamine-hydrolysing)